MAAIEVALFEALKADSNISTKVDDGNGGYHIYPVGIPKQQLEEGTEGSRYWVTYVKVSDKKITDLDLELPLFQINAVADRYTNAISLRDDIIRVLERFKGSLGSQRDVKFVHLEGEVQLRNPDTDLFYIPLSFRLKYLGDNV